MVKLIITQKQQIMRNTNKLHYLSTKQALEDYAVLINHLKEISFTYKCLF